MIPVIAGLPEGDSDADLQKFLGFITENNIEITDTCLNVHIVFSTEQMANNVNELINSEMAYLTLVGEGVVKNDKVKNYNLQCISLQASEDAMHRLESIRYEHNED